MEPSFDKLYPFPLTGCRNILFIYFFDCLRVLRNRHSAHKSISYIFCVQLTNAFESKSVCLTFLLVWLRYNRMWWSTNELKNQIKATIQRISSFLHLFLRSGCQFICLYAEIRNPFQNQNNKVRKCCGIVITKSDVYTCSVHIMLSHTLDWETSVSR